MSSVVEISAAIDKLDVKDAAEIKAETSYYCQL
jgi:hypothetical protein